MLTAPAHFPPFPGAGGFSQKTSLPLCLAPTRLRAPFPALFLGGKLHCQDFLQTDGLSKL